MTEAFFSQIVKRKKSFSSIAFHIDSSSCCESKNSMSGPYDWITVFCAEWSCPGVVNCKSIVKPYPIRVYYLEIPGNYFALVVAIRYLNSAAVINGYNIISLSPKITNSTMNATPTARPAMTGFEIPLSATALVVRASVMNFYPNGRAVS
jgi:hypothetical protein